MSSEAALGAPGAHPLRGEDGGDTPTSTERPPGLVSGRFHVESDGVRCRWSDELYALHRLTPGDVVPTVDLLLAHQHPDDRDGVRALLDDARLAGRRSACLSRLVDFAGHPHVVVMRVEADDDVPGDGPWSVAGWFVVLDAAFDAAVRSRVDAQLAEALESHSVIDRAKGVLAATCGYDDLEAFEALRVASQARNVKVRVLADEVVEAARRRGTGRQGGGWLRRVLGTAS